MCSFVRQSTRELSETSRELVGDDSGFSRHPVENQSLNYVGKLKLALPSLSVLTLSFQPRR